MAGERRRLRFRWAGGFDVEDDRGVRRRLLTPRELHAHAPARGWLRREAMARERAIVTAGWVVWGVWVAVFVLRLMVEFGPGLERAFWIVTTVQLPGLLWAFLLLGRLRARAFVNAWVAARACAACGYVYGEIRAEADGCVVCPECGAAWRGAGEAANPGTAQAQ